MNKTQLMVIGGFLGAGKTTAMFRIAEVLKTRGESAGLITNDQTDFLVDTQYLAGEKYPVTELTGSCFCCNYPGFAAKVDEMKDYDVILAEPVGSCTDLVSTIMKPSKAGKAGDLEVLPLSVMVEPERLKHFMQEDTSVFSKGVYYIMDKQLEEADFIIFNKIDLVDDQEKAVLTGFLKERYPRARICEISAQKGDGIASWLTALREFDNAKANDRKMAVDYDIYGNAEAEMGWLNAKLHVDANDSFDGGALVRDLAAKLRAAVAEEKGEIGHLKIYFDGGEAQAKLSCVAVDQPLVLDKESHKAVTAGDMTINLRAAVDPEKLKLRTEQSLEALGIKNASLMLEAFRPGFPNPTYRM